jgi:vitamin B12/bleomycin/antimicrobial peptide transport system ATP-binding/permease protein
MASLNFTQQRLEADFRHHLMRVREYSEAIALDRGGRVERLSLQERFAQVLDNFMRLLRVQKRYTWFNSGYGQAAVVFPMLVASPRYFSGAIQLGELMQISSAFGQVQESLSWFISNYSRLASWQATTLRLTSFQDQMLTLQANDMTAPESLTHTGINTLHTTPLTISLPNGDVLLADTSLNAAAGDTVLIRGPSGCGKSTLLRVLAGIWPHVTSPTHDRRGEPITYGPVVLPERCVFMPQRPYFPEGTLRQALAYPDSAEHYTDEALKNALYDALLPHMVNHLDVAGHWTQQLSGGEQQRLALARVLLKRPRWVFADEATSALDESAEKTLYEKLRTLVREEGGGLVSIAHRPSVASHHETVWQFVPTPEGSVAKFTLVVE